MAVQAPVMSARIVAKHAHMRRVAAASKTLCKDKREDKDMTFAGSKAAKSRTGSTGSMRPLAPTRATASMHGIFACQKVCNREM
jgi:hypothetical protein